MHVYAIEVDTPHGKRLIGPWYRTKEAAKSWVRFVKLAWHGCPTRTRTFTYEQAKAIQENGGQPEEFVGKKTAAATTHYLERSARWASTQCSRFTSTKTA